jgi:hypothetical protein
VTAPTSGPTTGTGPSRTDLEALCRPAVVDAYPDATETAVATAVERCADRLDGLTLEQAKARLDEVVGALGGSSDPDGPIPGLMPADPTTAPSTTPSADASADPAADDSASSGR